MTSPHSTPPLPLLQRHWALLLDVDGTMLDHIDDPASVLAAEDLRGVVAELRVFMGGAVGLVSGRALADLDRIFAPLSLPAVGQHGMEIRFAHGGVLRDEATSALIEAAARELRTRAGCINGVIVENKGLSLTLHYRARPDQREHLHELARSVTTQMGEALQCVEASHAFEIRPPLADKGRAIVTLMDDAPFHGRLPVFVGDDYSDEAGFNAVNLMSGLSIKVGPGDTRAIWRLPDPAAVRGWLHASAARLRDGPPEE